MRMKNDQRERLKNQMQHDAVLQQHLGRPFAVDRGELLLGLDAVVIDAENLAFRASVFDVGEPASRDLSDRLQSAVTLAHWPWPQAHCARWSRWPTSLLRLLHGPAESTGTGRAG